MKEVKSLISRSKRYMRSARLLIKDGDYEYTFVITDEEAKEVLKEGKVFIASVTAYLRT